MNQWRGIEHDSGLLAIPQLQRVHIVNVIVGQLVPRQLDPGSVHVHRHQFGICLQYHLAKVQIALVRKTGIGRWRRNTCSASLCQRLNRINLTRRLIVQVAQHQRYPDVILCVRLQSRQLELHLGRGDQILGRRKHLRFPKRGIVQVQFVRVP